MSSLWSDFSDAIPTGRMSKRTTILGNVIVNIYGKK
jgi:hypothetical protein